MKIIRAPQHLPKHTPTVTLYLAGSIDEAEEKNWRDELIEELLTVPITFIDPRCKNYNSTLCEQTEWELRAIKQADFVALYFAPDALSPISLFEFGFCVAINPKKLIVYCPDKFWKKRNVDAICQIHRIANCESWEEFIVRIRHRAILIYKRKERG